MARFDVSGLDGVLDEMEKRGELVGKAADAMIMTAAKETRDAWRKVARSHGYHDTGAMINSIGYRSAPKTVGSVRMAEIYPRGVDEKGIRNAEKAFILHYGTSKIKASYWVDEAELIAERNAYPAMVKVWDDYVKTGQLPSVEMPEIKEDAGTAKRISRTRKKAKKKSWLDEWDEKSQHRWY